jgi:large subunit ribosomal protein L22
METKVQSFAASACLPDKGRLVADMIRGKKVDQAINILSVHARRKLPASSRSVVESAIANAEHNDGADIDELKVKIDLRRTRPRCSSASRPGPRAAAHRISKPTCHIYVTVGN